MTNEEADKEYLEWVATRPPNVQAVALKFMPSQPLVLGDTGHLCKPYKFSENVEDGSVTVTVQVYNLKGVHWHYGEMGPTHMVFGLDAEDIVPVPVEAAIAMGYPAKWFPEGQMPQYNAADLEEEGAVH